MSMTTGVERSRLADRMPPTPEDLGPAQLEAEPRAQPKLSPEVFRLVAGTVGLFVAYLFWQATRLGGTANDTLIGDAFFIPFYLLAFYGTATAARRCRADRRLCWSRGFVALALFGNVIDGLLQGYHEFIRHLPDSVDATDVIF